MNDYLKHHGVKGMKWGVRKAPQRSGSSSKKKRKLLDFIFRRNKPNKPKTVKVVKQERATPKSVKNMSDTEIAQRTDRLQREKRLLDLEGTSTAQKGKSIMSEVAQNVARNAIQQIATQQIVKRGNAWIDKTMGVPKESADDFAKKAVAKEKEANANWINWQIEKDQQNYYDQRAYKATAWKRAKHARVA